MQEQDVTQAVAIQRKMFASLTELLELTQELSDALNRQDEVSVQMFLQLRQEEINHLQSHRATLRKRGDEMLPTQRQEWREVLSGSKKLQGNQAEQSLSRLVEQNQGLLNRIIQLDRVVSRRLCGSKSFYSQ